VTLPTPRIAGLATALVMTVAALLARLASAFTIAALCRCAAARFTAFTRARSGTTTFAAVAAFGRAARQRR
jgi:hypothetical protein